MDAVELMAQFRGRGVDVSYYRALLNEPTIFPNAVDVLYFVVERLQFTRIGPTLRGEVIGEAEAEAEIQALREDSNYEEV